MNIKVIDYGASNMQSVANALTTLGYSFEIISDPKQLESADKVILPGVGAAGSAMEKLRMSGFDKVLPTLKVPVLGLCLGMQLLADYSEEDDTKCLGIIPGNVVRFRNDLKVPHMGWNKARLTKSSKLTEGVADESFFYFVHSYYLGVSEFTIGETQYGVPVTAIVQKDNFYGTQFHPEKSGDAGMKILENFCKL